jgi:sugar lactone lactonase YvrE
MYGVLLLTACGPTKSMPEVNEPVAEAKEVELEPSQSTPPPEPTTATAAPTPPAKEPSAEPVLKYSGAFAAPESVLYDAANDRYLVSNVNGSPVANDDNGYILALSPDGAVTNPKLIAGGVNKVKLDAPKGMAIVGTELWVADIVRVRKFDLKTTEYKGEIKLPGATFANDIVAFDDGRVFVSDSGLTMTSAGFQPTGSDQVFVIDKAGKVKPLARGKELGGPNGLAIGTGNMLLTNTFNKDEVYAIRDSGDRDVVTKLPGDQLDGLVFVDDTLIVSSWEAETVYRGKLGGTFTPLITKVRGAADMGFDSKRKRLLVPRFLDDTVEVYDLK